MRGIHRLFATLAVLWLVVTGSVYLTTAKSPNPSSEGANILIGALAIYGIGLVLNFLIGGFRRKKRPFIDL